MFSSILEIGKNAKLALESRNNQEVIKFELEVNPCDVMRILEVLHDTAAAETEADTSEDPEPDQENISEDKSHDPLYWAKKYGFTYLHPTNEQ